MVGEFGEGGWGGGQGGSMEFPEPEELKIESSLRRQILFFSAGKGLSL